MSDEDKKKMFAWQDNTVPLYVMLHLFRTHLQYNVECLHRKKPGFEEKAYD